LSRLFNLVYVVVGYNESAQNASDWPFLFLCVIWHSLQERTQKYVWESIRAATYQLSTGSASSQY